MQIARTIWRSLAQQIMGSPSAPTNRAFEGVFAIHKPTLITSAQVIRNAQQAFDSSSLFKPWFEREQGRRNAESHNQRHKRRSWKQRQPTTLKMGHGGTLDPMATGVLILGIGNGTKALNRFLECTKTYETVVLFGVATDSYDAVGKVIARRSYSHVTKEMVEEALGKFRDKIMQRPPLFSALRMQGKRLYEYAREGKELPAEIQERPVQVEKLELVEWLAGGTHDLQWPTEEADASEKEVAHKVLHLEQTAQDRSDVSENAVGGGNKRKRHGIVDAGVPTPGSPSPKRLKSSPEPVMSGAIPDEAALPQCTPAQQSAGYERSSGPLSPQPCPAPAARIRMTVTSGFYVRSFAHDLGVAVDSFGMMSSLVRTRQGDFELNKNVMEYEELAKAEEIWAPKVEQMLGNWAELEKQANERQNVQSHD